MVKIKAKAKAKAKEKEKKTKKPFLAEPPKRPAGWDPCPSPDDK